MENRKEYIEVMQKMTAVIRGMMADILVIKEILARMQKNEDNPNTDELLETPIGAKDDGVYMINPEKMLRFMEQYKIR